MTGFAYTQNSESNYLVSYSCFCSSSERQVYYFRKSGLIPRELYIGQRNLTLHVAETGCFSCEKKRYSNDKFCRWQRYQWV